MTRRAVIVTLVLLLAGVSLSVEAYLKIGATVGGRLITIRWDRPVEYLVTNQDVTGVTAPQLQAAVARAFETWSAVPRTSFSHRFVGYTNALPVTGDGVSVIGFRNRPEFERTLAAASFDIDELTGRIIEVDIFFNSSQPWSVAAAGQTGRFDVESIGLHEVGHLVGLSHSALGETVLNADGGRRVTGKAAVMFPIAYPAGNLDDRALKVDDKAGFADLYGTSEAIRNTGAIGGRVTLNGRGIFGAHVVAMNTATGDLVSAFTVTRSGDFSMARLTPGLYVLRVEPIDDASVGSFMDDETDVELNFVPTFHTRVVAVPKGGQGPAVTIAVKGK